MNPQPTPDFSAEDRSALLDTVKRFATQAIAPNVNAWGEAGEGPDLQRSDTIPA